MNVLRQPLLHFLALGALLYGLYLGFANDDGGVADTTAIQVTGADIDALVEGWTRTWQRSPTPDEIVGMVEALIEEEVLYREALTLGLDRNDTIVRRRLRQKIEFLADDLVQIAQPDDVILQDYLDRNSERYQVSPALSLTYVYIDPQRHGDALDAFIAATLAELEKGADPGQLGDAFLLPMSYDHEPLDRLARELGNSFALSAAELEPGRWAGPIASSFGLHLVRIDDIVEGYLPDLDAVRQAVERDWYIEEREHARDEFFRTLAEKYDVEIVWPAGFTPPHAVIGWQP